MSENIVPQKKCTKCHEWKPATPEYFYRHKKSADGLYTQCKICKDSYRKTPKGRDVVRRKVAKWRKTENGKAFVKEKQSRKEARKPERKQARIAVGLAVKRGDLDRVSNCSCSLCGGHAENYHHWSYEPQHWLEVIPLCMKCHDRIHKMPNKQRVLLENKIMAGRLAA